MRDRSLERKIKSLKEFMELWVKFHDLYKNSTHKGAIVPEDERAFLETKSLIARKYQALYSSLRPFEAEAGQPENTFPTARLNSTIESRMFDCLGALLSLEKVASMSDDEITKIENDWQNSYIMLNKILGSLENRKEELAARNAFVFVLRGALKLRFVRLLLGACLALAIFSAALQRFGIGHALTAAFAGVSETGKFFLENLKAIITNLRHATEVKRGQATFSLPKGS